MAAGTLLDGALRRERGLVIGCLLFVVALAWAYLLAGAGMNQAMGDMQMPMSSGPWTAAHALIVLAMWAAMMAAMMLPSAAPMILLHATLARRQRERGTPAGAAGAVAAGYLATWVAFSLAATALQCALERAALLTPMMRTSSPALAAALLVAAGLYQWTPLKRACLRHCRSPLEWVLTRWRPGGRGAFLMGLRHGAACVGCCWLLMLLLFVGGVMSLAWIAGIAIFVLVEKLSPAGHWIGRAMGVLLILGGAAMGWAAAV